VTKQPTCIVKTNALKRAQTQPTGSVLPLLHRTITLLKHPNRSADRHIVYAKRKSHLTVKLLQGITAPPLERGNILPAKPACDGDDSRFYFSTTLKPHLLVHRRLAIAGLAQ
jgi:hypothetical protein